MHEVLVNRLGGLSLSRKSVVRLTDRPDMTLDVYRGRKTTIQHYTHSLSTMQSNRSLTAVLLPFYIITYMDYRKLQISITSFTGLFHNDNDTKKTTTKKTKKKQQKKNNKL